MVLTTAVVSHVLVQGGVDMVVEETSVEVVLNGKSSWQIMMVSLMAGS
jgi:hypothetical protein